MVKITELPPTTADELTVADYLPVVIEAAGVTKKITMGELRGHIAVHADDLDSLAGSLSDVSAVATDLAAVQSVAADLTDVSAVAADLVDIKAVAADQSDIDAVAADLPDIKAAAANMAGIQAAPQAATDAADARDGAEAFRNEAETLKNQAAASAADAAVNGAPSALLSKHIRAQYGVQTRAPVVVIDPVTETYFGPNGPEVLTDLTNFVRNSGASFTDGAGVIQTVAADMPRVNHHVLKDGIWQRAGLRVDTQATNLFAGSDDPAQWYVPPTMELDTEVGIGSGGGNLFRMRGATGGSGNLRLGISDNRAVSLATLQCFSFDARADGLNRLRFSTGNEGPGIDPSTVWDVSTGDVIATGASVIRAGIHDLGGGLYRCFTVWQSSATDGAVAFDLQLCLNTTTSSGGSSAIPVDPSSSVIVGNFQHEEGVGAPSSYIKTATVPVTRAGDVITMAGADIPSPANGFTVIVDGDVDWLDTDSSTHTYFFKWYKTASPSEIIRMGIEQAGSVVSRVVGQAYKGAWSESEAPSPYDPLGEGLARPFRVALTLSSTHVQTVANGVAYAQVALPNGIPDPSSVAADLLENFNGTLSRLRIFDTALPEAALITETTL